MPLTDEDLNDWMRGIQSILKQHRKDLDSLNAKLDGIQRYLNSSEVLAALARGVQKEEGENGKKRRERSA